LANEGTASNRKKKLQNIRDKFSSFLSNKKYRLLLHMKYEEIMNDKYQK